MIDPSAIASPETSTPLNLRAINAPPAAVSSPTVPVSPPMAGGASIPLPMPRSPLPWRRQHTAGPVLDAVGEPVSFAPDAGNVEYLIHVALVHDQLVEAVRELIAAQPEHDGVLDGECNECAAVAFGQMVLAKVGAP
jgi:hypothetical protein